MLFFAETIAPQIKISEGKTGIKLNSTVKFYCNASSEYYGIKVNMNITWDHIPWDNHESKKISEYQNVYQYTPGNVSSVSSTLFVKVLPDAYGIYTCEVTVNYKNIYDRFYKNSTLTAGNHTLYLQNLVDLLNLDYILQRVYFLWQIHTYLLACLLGNLNFFR